MEVKNQKVYPGLKNNVLSKLKGDAFCIKMVVDLRNSDFLGLMIRANKKSNGTELGYNVQRQLISLAGHNKKYIPKNNRIELELLIDRSSIEVFIDGGEEVISASFTPEPNANRYELFTRGGEIIIESLEVYPLKSIWR
jgi:sucrose-6-phosphate hydrolase SacC (GH32 family)